VKGIAEEISENLLSIMNEGINFEIQQDIEDRIKDRSRQSRMKFKKFWARN
jgi:hypothetical protein